MYKLLIKIFFIKVIVASIMYGRTELHIAVIEEQIDVVTDLLNQGADVNANECTGKSPLYLAVETRNLAIIKLLLDAGADVYSKNYMNRSIETSTPFNKAVSSNNSNILRLFLVAGNVNPPQFSLCPTPLQCAAMWGNSSVVKMLINAGADVNAKPDYDLASFSPLEWAIKSGNYHILKLLIDSGASLNAKRTSFYQNTPLHVAAGAERNFCWCDRTDKSVPAKVSTYNRNLTLATIKLLLRAGANLNELNGSDQTPLETYIENSSDMDQYQDEGSTEECLKFLIECTDLNLKDRNGRNVISRISQLKFRSSDLRLARYTKHSPRIVEHIAKLENVNLPVNPSLISSIARNKLFKRHYGKCITELKKAKNTKLKKCWVTFFNLLGDDKTKLVKYAGNQDLVKDFQKRVKKFPIYGNWMRINMSEGINGRKLYDGAVSNLSYHLPIFKPTHLIVREVLDTLDEEDWKKLSGRKRFNE